MVFRTANPVRKLQSALPTTDDLAAATGEVAFATVIAAVATERLKAGAVIRGKIKGFVTTSGTPVTPTLRLKYGATTLATLASLVLEASKTNSPFEIDFELVVGSIGETGSITASMRIVGTDVTAKVTEVLPAAVTVDTTADANLTLTVQSNAATGGNTVGLKSVVTELVA